VFSIKLGSINRNNSKKQTGSYMKKSLLTLTITTLLLSACSEPSQTNKLAATASATVEKITEQDIVAESNKANQLFEDIFNASVKRSPIMQTYLGMKTDYDKWDDLSEAHQLKELEIAKQNLAKVKTLNPKKLSKQTLLSYQLMLQKLQNQIDDFQWRHYNYPVNQMFGMHAQIPAFLINQHSISSEQQANDYIARLNNVKPLLAQLVEQLKIREQEGIIAPKFVFDHVIRDAKNILNGAPFDEGSDSTLLVDFKNKVNKLSLSDEKKLQLIDAAKQALLTQFKPAYEELISYLHQLQAKADNIAGVWKLPKGDVFYNNALKRTTTTTLSAEQIHNIGLQEVERIHNEMKKIKEAVNFNGSLHDFFHFMRDDPQFYYPDNESGRSRYLTEARTLIEQMKARLDELFITKPKADLIVKRVEAFREKSAGKAFYEQPAPDGSRPGTYYANLYDMKAMPTYQMAALAYHEGIPGHHMQIAIKQELKGIPKFRKFGSYTAYTEGWGLYSEKIPKEIGFYQDPYSDFGRLAMELWRACRLVVDTGIHTKKWTREQGIDFYLKNTPNAKSDAIKMVERHIVMPSQATAYKIGMNKIIELRAHAKKLLGDKFDIREFHDVILKNGPLPLNVLESMVDDYIKSKL
jgi:uncharacterized protein (DUF885 family)